MSKTVGLRRKLWRRVNNALPTYLDADGLANYFPPRAGTAPRGSDRLTAYLIAATHEAGFARRRHARHIPGLVAFVEGRIARKFWSPAFASRGPRRAQDRGARGAVAPRPRQCARCSASINLRPTWPDGGGDRLARHPQRRVEGIPSAPNASGKHSRSCALRQPFAGTTLQLLQREEDFWWWLMDSADANAAKLILATLDEPGWKGELPRLVIGSWRARIAAPGHHHGNLWGSLRSRKFAAVQAERVGGRNAANTGAAPPAFGWSAGRGAGVSRSPSPRPGHAAVQQTASKPRLTVQNLAAIRSRHRCRAGYAINRSVSVVEQKEKALVARRRDARCGWRSSRSPT